MFGVAKVRRTLVEASLSGLRPGGRGARGAGVTNGPPLQPGRPARPPDLAHRPPGRRAGGAPGAARQHRTVSQLPARPG